MEYKKFICNNCNFHAEYPNEKGAFWMGWTIKENKKWFCFDCSESFQEDKSTNSPYCNGNYIELDIGAD